MFGVVVVTNAFLPALRGSAHPRIVNVSSGTGSFTWSTGANPQFDFRVAARGAGAAYRSSKAALNALPVFYAHVLADDGIKVNALARGLRATQPQPCRRHHRRRPGRGRGGCHPARHAARRRPLRTALLLRRHGGAVVRRSAVERPAVTFERCVRAATNRRWVGLTATPRRRDGLEGILHMQLGPTRHTMSDDATTALTRRDLVVHDTLTDPDAPEDAGVQAVLGLVAADTERTRQICVDVADAHRRGRNVLVFTNRTEHLEALRAELSGRHGLDPAVLKGGTGKKRHAAVLDGLRSGGAPILLLATGAYLGEGFDLPALDTLFLAFPVSGRSRVVQYVGRVTRALPDKTSVEVHDYHDTLHPLLRRMHQRRLAALKSIGFNPSAPA